MKSINYGDGSQWTASTWDQAWRRLAGRVAAGETGFFQEEIEYDADDQVTAGVWGHSAVNGHPEAQVYSYDELGRLTEFRQGAYFDQDIDGTFKKGVSPVSPQYRHTWQLDELANWRQHNPGTELTPPVDGVNAYTAWPVEGNPEALELLYDRASGFLWSRELKEKGPGNETQKLQFVHDGLGRLFQVKRTIGASESVVATFGYDAVGRRVWRTTGTPGPAAPVTYFVFVYDGPNVIEEVQGNGDSLPYQVKRHYVWAGSQLVKSKEGILAEEYFHQDRLGSVVLSTKATDTGTIKAGHAVYDPYGLEVTAASWGFNTLTVPYRFAGARLDLTDLNGDNTADNTEFYLMGARWYDPEMGRFLEQDPLGEEGGLNLYAYTGSSPILWVDPSGLRAEPTSSDRIIAEAESAARDKHAEFNDWVAQGDAEARAREEEEEKKKDPNQKPATPDKTADGSINQPSTTGTGDTDKDGTPDAQAGTDTQGSAPPGKGGETESTPSEGKCGDSLPSNGAPPEKGTPGPTETNGPQKGDGSVPEKSPSKIFKGEASYYDLPGKKTASGEMFDGKKMAGAMTAEKSKLGQTVKVTITFTNAEGFTVIKTISVVVNDRGPFAVNEKGKAVNPLKPHPDRIIDLTPAAFLTLTGSLNAGHVPVTVKVPNED